MLDAQVFIGLPLNFKGKFKVYPPKIKDVLSNDNFHQMARILTITQEDIMDDYKNRGITSKSPTPLEFLLVNSYHNTVFEFVAKQAFKFFLHEDVEFLYEDKKILIGKARQVIQTISSVDELKYLEEEDYFEFQNLIRTSLGYKEEKPPQQESSNPVIRKIQQRARERDRIKARQSAKDGISIKTTLTAICCMGLGLTPLNIGEMSYAALGEIMKMSQEKEKYDIDIRSLLAGADSKKIKPKYWIRNSDKE